MRLPLDRSRTVGRDATEAALKGDFAVEGEVQRKAKDLDHDDAGELSRVLGDRIIRFPVDDEIMT